MYFGGDYYCRPLPVVLALAPGLLNLIPIFWLRSTSPKTRFAAAVATILGALRLAVPVIAVFAGAVNTEVAEGPRADISTAVLMPVFPNNNSFGVTVVSLVLWLATFVAIAVIARLDIGGREPLPPRHGAPSV
jgi:hypothetical protein